MLVFLYQIDVTFIIIVNNTLFSFLAPYSDILFTVYCFLRCIISGRCIPVYIVCFRANCCQSLCATLVTFFITSRVMKCTYCWSTSGHMLRCVMFLCNILQCTGAFSFAKKPSLLCLMSVDQRYDAQ